MLNAAIRGAVSSCALGALLALGACAALPVVETREVPTVTFVFFDDGSAELTESSQDILKDASRYVRGYENVSIVLAAHMTKAEDLAGNKIDAARFDAVQARLIELGVDEDKITGGPVGPIEILDTESDNGAADRRVDIGFIVSAPETAAQ